MADLFLGAGIDPTTGKRGEGSTIVETEDLTTHAVIVGMTGSGKTGLGVVLIEEVLSAGIPALLIDPKGDLTNLALVFPGLSGPEFRPWVNESDAAKAGQSADDFAVAQATTWKDGLAGWGVEAPRLAAFKQGVDVAIYTPGSSAGIPINILGSLNAPADMSDSESINDEIEGYATSLLGMLGLDADPLTSREHILLANLIYHAWSQGQNLDLPTLLAMVQQPPIRKLGVLELDAFFPAADRQTFALRMNGLLASPSFSQWMQGPALDIPAMLHAPDGRPRCAVVSTAHLSDDERQSVTALVLSKLITWMRSQSGTTDLRVLLYMDEVAGYVPPTANPPTKKPIMTLMKQARAFGVGVVLATQNPVDVDYKALSNTGTWLIGRLQTERDKQRLIDGLASADGGVDVSAAAATISSLAKRQFLLRRASGKQEVITTRWAMSYLRGPLTREQIGSLVRPPAAASATATATAPPISQADPTLSAPAVAAAAPAAGTATVAASVAATPAPVAASAATVQPAATPLAADETPVIPAVAGGVPIAYADPGAAWVTALSVGAGSRYQAGVIARVHLRYDETKADLLHDQEYEAVLVPLPSLPDASGFRPVDYDDRDLSTTMPTGAVYRLPTADIAAKSWWTALQRSLTDTLVRRQTLEIFINRDLKLYSRPGESRDQFASRCANEADNAADKATAALRSKYEARVRTKRDQLTQAGARVQGLETQHDAQFQADIASTVGGMLGGLLGGRKRRADLGGIAKRRSTSAARVDAAAQKARAYEIALTDLERDLADEVADLGATWAGKAAAIESMQVPLESSDVRVVDLRLVWLPQ